MSSSSNNLNTLYGPYRTAEAISRAPNADFIPLEGNRNINAVHPIPVDWLREELLSRERDCVRRHLEEQISTLDSRNTGYGAALEATMANLNAVNNMGTTTRGVPSQHSSTNAVDNLTDEFGGLTTAQSHGVRSPTRSVRYSQEVQTERVSRDFRVSGPYSPQPSFPPPRSILRSPGHARTQSATATMGFVPLPQRNAREPSPTDGFMDDLAALDIQLDEIHGRINEPTSPQGAIRDRRNTNVATARSNIRRLRGLRSLTREDVDTARASVHSVMSAAGRDEVELSVESDEGLRGGRVGRVRPTSNIPSSTGEQIRLATYQQQQRDHAHAIGLYPAWSSPPVDPQYGDIIETLDGEVHRFSSSGRWQLYDDRSYGSMFYYCD
jgi:hypothetical protein